MTKFRTLILQNSCMYRAVDMFFGAKSSTIVVRHNGHDLFLVAHCVMQMLQNTCLQLSSTGFLKSSKHTEHLAFIVAKYSCVGAELI